MNKAGHALPDNSRRQFLKATAFGVAGAALGARPGLSAPKTMSIMHENSFIKTFDEYFQKTLIPAYEKLTGVKISTSWSASAACRPVSPPWRRPEPVRT